MTDHAEKQVERIDKHRKLPAEGHFLAGEAAYDKHGNLLPTGTVPVPDPHSQPDRGALTDHPAEQHASAPPAPVTPDPYGGTVSSSHANPPANARGLSTGQPRGDDKDESPNKARIEKKEAGHAGPGQ